ncbi:recombinase family protein [Acidocella sp.]|uniref:recombinase family protein n=1 Tax=Acidocella sp. TaxID=50710 RepID=UPI0026378FB9|nr:recombinase family protein [Acidocella sp.]
MLGYARVSMADQDNRRQVDELVRAGVDLANIWQDKASGKNMDRPGWKLIWKALRPGDVLVVVSIDRIGRSLLEVSQVLEELHARGCELKILNLDVDTRTPLGRFIFSIMAAFAQMEREFIRERTLSGLAAARARGHVGGAKKKVSDDQIRDAIARIEAGEFKSDLAKELGISRVALDKRIKQMPEKDMAKEIEKNGE